ncbi:MAG: ribonucleoside-diphosphate reductase, adenosylcobalamin-dependent, partial [Nanoarchaeota archaeon]
QNTNLRNIYGDYIVHLGGQDLAIHYAGDFLLYFNSDQTKEIKRLIKAKELWDRFVASNYKTAEPGLIFWSKMTKYSPSNYVGRPIITTNPCAEISLEDGGACNLSAMNLSRFVDDGYTENAKINWELLKESVTNVTRFLDNTITWNMFMNPLEKQRVATSETRRLGLGVMGIADMLNQLGIGYDSDKGLEIIEKVMKFIANTAYKASSNLSLEKEPSPLFSYENYSKCPFFKEAIDQDVKDLIRRNGIRNIAILTIAPTGTISNVVLGFKNKEKYYVGVSSGMEPIFALYYQRRSETLNKEESSKFYNVFHPTIQAFIDLKKMNEKAQDITNLEELRKVLPENFFRTSHFINAEKRVEIQGICQKYIDHSISSTVNLPESIKPEAVSSIYFDAWKKGLKGITIYRDGSRYPILSVAQEQTEFQEVKKKTFKVYTNNEELVLKGDEVFALENGLLSTAYHSIKENHPVRIEELNLATGESIISSFIEKSVDKNTCEIKIEDGKVVKTCE